jgi:hypothetical protein
MTFPEWLRGFVSIHFHAPVQINFFGRRTTRAIPAAAASQEPARRLARPPLRIVLVTPKRDHLPDLSFAFGRLPDRANTHDWHSVIKRLEGPRRF